MNLDHYENTYENFQIQIISFGLVIACFTFWLKYTYFNGDIGWLRISKKILDMIQPKITVLRCLFGLWAIPTFKYAFDLDLLIYLHQLGYCDYAARKR